MLDLRITRQFFDRKAVTSKVDRAARRVLSRFGAFVRRTAKSSIRNARRKSLGDMTAEERAAHEQAVRRARRRGRKRPRRPFAPSRPGEPPRSIKGTLRRGILFAYEPRRKNVVIGPVKVVSRAKVVGASTVPAVLEYGGTSVIKGRPVDIAERPYMRPAMEKERPQLPALWKDAVK